MLLKNKEATIAYRCPHCGSGILSMVGVFALSGDMIKLKCDCGHSELIIQNTKDGKLRLTVPCFLCPKPHTFVISRPSFFDEDILAIPCNMTGVDICFIGGKEAVLAALDSQEEAVLTMLRDSGYNVSSIGDVLANLPDGDEDTDPNFTDNHIYDMVLYVVRDLEEEGKIRCRCTEHGLEGHYDVVCDRDRIFVTCDICGARREILCNGSVATQAFLDTDELILEGLSAEFDPDPPHSTED